MVSADLPSRVRGPRGDRRPEVEPQATKASCCDFLCHQRRQAPTFRSPRITPRPVIAGPQTAIVVGAPRQRDRDRQARPHQDPVPLGPARREGREQLVLGARRAAVGRQGLRHVQPAAGRPRGGRPVPGRRSRPAAGHRLGLQQRQHDRPWKLPDAGDGQRLQDAEQQGAATPTRPTSCASTTRRTASTSGSTPRRTSTARSSNDAFDWVGNNESVKVTLTRKEVIGENWFLDVTKDVMHNLGKDLHVNVAGDIFYTGGATYQLKLKKDLSAKVDGDLGVEVDGKTQLKSKGDIVLESTTGKIVAQGGDASCVEADHQDQGRDPSKARGGRWSISSAGRRRHRRQHGEDQLRRRRRLGRAGQARARRPRPRRKTRSRRRRSPTTTKTFEDPMPMTTAAPVAQSKKS